MSKPIQQTITFKASPDVLYETYMSSAKHSAFTGSGAEISPDEGGAFSCHDGQVVGRNIELVPGRRIVQAWRIAAWPEGLYTTVRLELTANDQGAQLEMSHAGVPTEFADQIASGWTARYWDPLRKYLADS